MVSVIESVEIEAQSVAADVVQTMPFDAAMQLTRFGIQDMAIARMRDEYMPLTISGVEDKAGAKKVTAARKTVKKHRTTTEAVRKELKAEALEYGQKVDAEAKRITELLLPIEKHLEEQEDAYEAAVQAIKDAEKAKAEAEAEAAWQKILDEQKRLADEAAAKLKAEQDAAAAKLAAERVELEKAQEELRAARAEVEEARKVLAEAEATRLENARAEEEAAKPRNEPEPKEIVPEVKTSVVESVATPVNAVDAFEARKKIVLADAEALLGVADAVGAINMPPTSGFATETAAEVVAILDDAQMLIKHAVDKMVKSNAQASVS